jgi:hypothetical protein
MKIEILAHGNTSPNKVMLMQNTTKFFAKYLNLDKSDYKLYVCSAPNLRKNDGNNGIASKTGAKEISIAIDSTLQLPQMLITLAHEMVHAKQYIRGHYKASLSRNGRHKRFWLGKQYAVAYARRPWEKEACRRESELVCALISNVAQKVKKQSKFT